MPVVTRNCRAVIKAIQSCGAEARYKNYGIHQVVELTHLSTDAVISACEQLRSDGLMEIHYFSSSYSRMIDTVHLTELGANYGEVQRDNARQYILSHWIDFFALLVSLVSLALATAAFFKG